jgi:hypothetical protein
MKDLENNAISPEGKLILESLQRAVAQALEKKRRLGQYAVILKEGKPVAVGDDAPGQRQ